MTDKLKCPFCGSELKECFVGMTHLTCTNIRCDYASLPLLPKVWQALIDGKKARDALNYVLPNLDAYMNMYLETRRNPSEFAVANEYINNIKRKITFITKQEK